MKKTYNLALVPISKTSEIIALANKFANIADEYLLGTESLSHVTLYHFQAELFIDKPISDEFILSLGWSDNVGQLTKIIYV